MPTTHVLFHNEERVGVKHVRTWIETFGDDNIIIVSLEGPTSFTRKETDNSYKNVQYFMFKQICVNVTHHHMVPKHERMTPDQIRLFPYGQSNNSASFPRLYTTDPISQYYDYKVGDIIRIVRTVGTQEPMYYYRIVCLPAH